MKKTYIAALCLCMLCAVLVGAKSIIMKIEMKDGTERYIDTESVSAFDFIDIDEVPEAQVSNILTDTLSQSFEWVENGFLNITKPVTLIERYIPNDPYQERELIVVSINDSLKNIKIKTQYLSEDISSEVTVPCQPSGITDPELGEIWVADYNTYVTEVLEDVNTAGLFSLNENYFLTLNLVYYPVEYKKDSDKAKNALVYLFPQSHYNYIFRNIFNSVEGDAVNGYKIKSYIDIDEPEISSIDVTAQIVSANSEISSPAGNTVTIQNGSWINNVVECPVDPTLLSGDMIIQYHLDIKYINGTTYRTNYNFLIRKDSLEEDKARFYTSFLADYQPSAYYHASSPIQVSCASFLDFDDPSTGLELAIKEYYTPAYRFSIPDLNDYNPDGTIKAHIHETILNQTEDYNDSTYRIAVMEYNDFLKRLEYDPIATESFYDPETARFVLHPIFYLDGTKIEIGRGLEVLYTGKINDYFLQLGTPEQNENSDKLQIQFSVETGRDISYVKVAAIPSDINNPVDEILKIADTLPAIRCHKPTEVTLDIPEFGAYKLIALAYSYTDRPIAYEESSFTLKDMSKYTFIGYSGMIDGWLLPGFYFQGNPINPYDYPFGVKTYKYTGNDIQGELYLLEGIYSSEDFLLSEYNESPLTRHVEILIDGNNVCIQPQLCGFSYSGLQGGAEMVIGNAEGMYMLQDGISLTEAIAKVSSEYRSYYENGCIVVPLPLFGFGVDDFGYNWRNLYPVEIHLPDEADATKAKAARVAKPDITSVAVRATADSAIRTFARMPVQFDPAKAINKVMIPRAPKKSTKVVKDDASQSTIYAAPKAKPVSNSSSKPSAKTDTESRATALGLKKITL